MEGIVCLVRRAGWVGAATLVALALCVSGRGAVHGTKIVGLHLIAVRGSREGEESVDPRLAEMGEKLKKKFKTKRLEVIDETNFGATAGLEITTALGDDMKIKMEWGGASSKNMAQFTITVLRGKETIIRDRLKIPLNETALSVGKLDKDILILVMTAELVDE